VWGIEQSAVALREANHEEQTTEQHVATGSAPRARY